MTGNFYVPTGAALTSDDDTWTTPRNFFNELHSEFNFTLDAAALKSSTLVPENWFGPDHEVFSRRNALVNDWKIENGAVWLNPPYGRKIKDFMSKAHHEAKGG